MRTDAYRSLVALRHVGESIDEMNVFLAQAMESNLRLQKTDAWHRFGVYAGFCLAAILGAITIEGDLFWPAIVLAAYLGVSAIAAYVQKVQIDKQRDDLLVEHESFRDYLLKAKRDRLDNGVSLAIQNRAMAAELAKDDSIGEGERSFLNRNVEYWGRRIGDMRGRMGNQDDELWNENASHFEELIGLIDAELHQRPVNDAAGSEAGEG